MSRTSLGYFIHPSRQYYRNAHVFSCHMLVTIDSLTSVENQTLLITIFDCENGTSVSRGHRNCRNDPSFSREHPDTTPTFHNGRQHVSRPSLSNLCLPEWDSRTLTSSTLSQMLFACCWSTLLCPATIAKSGISRALCRVWSGSPGRWPMKEVRV